MPYDIKNLQWFGKKYAMTLGLKNSIKEACETFGVSIGGLILGVLMLIYSISFLIPLLLIDSFLIWPKKE